VGGTSNTFGGGRGPFPPRPTTSRRLPVPNALTVAPSHLAHPTSASALPRPRSGRARPWDSSQTDDLALRIDRTLTTIEALERYEGHLFELVRHADHLRPLPPFICFDRRQRAILPGRSSRSRWDCGTSRRCSRRRASALFDAMNFRWPCSTRSGNSFGDRLSAGRFPSAPGRLDGVVLTILLASEARPRQLPWPSPRADVPEMPTGFRLGRIGPRAWAGLPCSSRGSATLFEYLIAAARHADVPEHPARRNRCRAGGSAARWTTRPPAAVPWGDLGVGPTNLVDRPRHPYQYKGVRSAGARL